MADEMNRVQADKAKARPIHEAIDGTIELLKMQLAGKDVMIPYWMGNPGIAKTSLAKKIAQQLEHNFLPIHMFRPEEEYSGIPKDKEIQYQGEKIPGTVWTRPDLITEACELSDNGRPTMVFMDDMHRASPNVMTLGYEIFTERKLRSYKFPDNTYFLLAGNTSAKAGAKALFSAIVNRCAMIPVFMDFDWWKFNYAIRERLNETVLSFLSNKRYQNLFEGEEQIGKPWPSPRAWTRFANFLTAMEKSGRDLNQNDVIFWCASHVGDEATSEFAAYYKIFSKIDTEHIFSGNEVNVPDDEGNAYILTLACVNDFINRFVESISVEDQTNLLDTMARVIISVARKKSHIAATALKEIVLIETAMGLPDLYFRIRKVIERKSPGLAQKLAMDISAI